MKITGKCEDCKKVLAAVGLNGHKLCLACFDKALAATSSVIRAFGVSNVQLKLKRAERKASA